MAKEEQEEPQHIILQVLLVQEAELVVVDAKALLEAEVEVPMGVMVEQAATMLVVMEEAHTAQTVLAAAEVQEDQLQVAVAKEVELVELAAEVLKSVPAAILVSTQLLLMEMSQLML